MKIQVDIFSGFLGAGKTMLIRKLLIENVYSKDTIIIENEFGEVGIDGDILKECNISVKEINSGCICCQVSGDFSKAIAEVIKKYSPVNIIIEPSGVAKLSEIINLLKEENLKDKIEIRNIITVIDIKNYELYIRNFKDFYENQIRNAYKLILSRSQLVDKLKIENVVNSLTNLNSKAEIIHKPWEYLNGFDLIEIKREKEIKEKNIIKLNANKIVKRKANNEVDNIFESYPIEFDFNMNTEEIQKKFIFIESSSKFGKIIRAKGITKGTDGSYYQFDYVPKEFNSRKIKWANRKVVSIIGSELNRKELKQLFGGL
ncbi:GTP-binding protein [Clostridium sp. C2-6-12]|uniref:GTP-binding protein n=1 Tax=Clostridium sp. C2-6-12 TaxID=2698832 RepID=UPI00136F11EA|nr:GTP-binding protein [Clostridium sp. C2-6-12]